MSNEISLSAASLPWPSYVQPIAQLWQALPILPNAPVWAMLAAPQALDALRAAAAQTQRPLVTLDAHSTQDQVAAHIAQTRPGVVVCAPEVFGWVSKIAFLNHVHAVYTCGEGGEGTLLDRARHCVAMP